MSDLKMATPPPSSRTKSHKRTHSSALMSPTATDSTAPRQLTPHTNSRNIRNVRRKLTPVENEDEATSPSSASSFRSLSRNPSVSQTSALWSTDQSSPSRTVRYLHEQSTDETTLSERDTSSPSSPSSSEISSDSEDESASESEGERNTIAGRRLVVETSSSSSSSDGDESDTDQDETGVTSLPHRPKPDFSTFRPGGGEMPSLMARLQDLLPKMKSANEELERERVAGTLKDRQL
ncbi:hypothetical protein K402DRAFT_390278, partial [Aulographum hederae CBS 113979]